MNGGTVNIVAACSPSPSRERELDALRFYLIQAACSLSSTNVITEVYPGEPEIPYEESAKPGH